MQRITWEYAAEIYTENLLNGEHPPTKEGSKQEILRMARLLDKLLAETQMDEN